MLREASYSSIRLGLYDPIKAVIAPHATGLYFSYFCFLVQLIFFCFYFLFLFIFSLISSFPFPFLLFLVISFFSFLFIITLIKETKINFLIFNKNKPQKNLNLLCSKKLLLVVLVVPLARLLQTVCFFLFPF